MQAKPKLRNIGSKKVPSKISEFLDAVFRDPSTKHGLRFFANTERDKLRFRIHEGNVEIWCSKRESWKRAKPEEVVRQLFLVWVRDSLKYPLNQIEVEWPLRAGINAEKERVDIVIFTDQARTNPFILFELKRPKSKDGIEQLQSYLKWTGCFFGCWSNGNDVVYQLREEDAGTRKAPYTYRDIPRLPKIGEDAKDLLHPLTRSELLPLVDLRGMIERLEDDVLSNAGVNTFDELFKVFFAKLHD